MLADPVETPEANKQPTTAVSKELDEEKENRIAKNSGGRSPGCRIPPASYRRTKKRAKELDGDKRPKELDGDKRPKELDGKESWVSNPTGLLAETQETRERTRWG